MPRYSEITKEILSVLGQTGKLILTGEHAEFGIRNWRLSSINPEYLQNKEERRKFSQALWRLKKSRLIIVQEKQDEKFMVELTEKGKRKLREFQFTELTIPKPKEWDRRWRVVIFDIPEKKKRAREALREKIKQLNFYQLQESVWVHPYPCEAEIEFICELFDIAPYVNILTATYIKNDIGAKKHFHLPL